MRETNMNDVMAVIIFMLGSVGLVFALIAWARSRHREITSADRLLASLLTAGHCSARKGGKSEVYYPSHIPPGHHSVPIHYVLVHSMLALHRNSEGRS